jgi:hypothetical protein
MSGNALGGGPVPNPWTFTTGTAADLQSPVILTTVPIDQATGVAVTQDVVITFNESIDPTSFAYTITPDPGSWGENWNATNEMVTMTHANFASNTLYTFTVTSANDTSNNPLIPGPVPNPWEWTTVDAQSPEITVTNPVNMATGVLMTQDVVITFSEEIDTATFMWTIAPDPGGWTWVWSAGNTTATGSHTNFADNTTYNFTVTAADDLAGNPLAAGAVANPWNWTTEILPTDLEPPIILTTSPINGAGLVALDASVVITFNETIDTATFVSTSSPDPLGWAWVWSVGDTVATGTHNDFLETTLYTLNVTAADDMFGNSLAAGPVPNPWTFSTLTLPDTTAPVILLPSASPSSQSGAGPVNITANVTDDSGTVDTVKVEVYDPTGTLVGNFTMIFDPSTDKYYYSRTYTVEDSLPYDYTIWASDPSSNYASATGTFYITEPIVIGATILGNITSGSDRLNGATVELFDSAGNSLTTTTSANVAGLDGIYMLVSVDPGTYDITVSKDGYTSLTKTVTVGNNDLLKIVNFDLESSGDLLWLWILLILMIIIIVIVIIILMSRKKKPEEEPAPETLEEMEAVEGEEVAPEGAEEELGADEAVSEEPGGEEPAAEESAAEEPSAEEPTAEESAPEEMAAEEPAAEEPAAAAAGATAADEPSNCVNCGKTLKPGFKICPYCGSNQES